MSGLPRRLVFIWFGPCLTLGCRIAIRSAVEIFRPRETLLIHEGLDESRPELKRLLQLPGFRLQRGGPEWFGGLPEGGESAGRIFRSLESPSARSNLLRLAVLWKLGGVYLDSDTVAVRDLDELWDLEGFCGLEPVALPAEISGSLNPTAWAAAGFKLGLREILARWPRGYRAFRSFEGLYKPCVNNAILGASPGNRLIRRAFEAIGRMSERERGQRYALGPNLLQKLTGNETSADMTVLPAEYFYPLGPVMSAHWFHRNSAKSLKDLLCPETRVVHWYQSVASRLSVKVDARTDLEKLASSAFAALARPYVESDAGDGESA